MAYGKNQWYYLYNISYVSYTAYKINDIIIDKISVLRIRVLKGMRARDQLAYLTPRFAACCIPLRPEGSINLGILARTKLSLRFLGLRQKQMEANGKTSLVITVLAKIG